MIRIFACALSALSLFAVPAMAGEIENYCDDPEKSVEWRELVAKYPGDDNLQALHALRIGLCEKIDRGTISFRRANSIFNQAHQLLIEKKQADQLQGEKNRWN